MSRCRFLLALLPLTLLAACTAPPQGAVPSEVAHQHAPTPQLTAAALPSTATPPLVKSYWGVKLTYPGTYNLEQQEPENRLYRPRQFAPGLTVDFGTVTADYGTQTVASAGAYAGWDVLSLPNIYTESRIPATDPSIVINLNRAAKVAVVWRPRGTLPAWLSSWTPGGTVSLNSSKATAPNTYTVYVKTFPAGTVRLNGIGRVRPDASQNYFVLLAEQGGAPSQAPTVPAGQQTPTPNQPCPAWVHDQYVAQGPDGKLYPTWHPEVDPVYWCYFGHEHGSDPALAGVGADGEPLFQPVYGYTAAQHGMTEPHAGFKTHLIPDPKVDGLYWFWTVHMGSSGLGRVCQNMHTVDMAALQNGVLKADLHFMGDFGRARYVNQGAAVTPQPITGCPIDQNTIDGHGGRSIVTDSSGYEAWGLASDNLVLGLDPKYISFKTSFPATDCANPPLCTQLRRSLHGDVGTVRTIQYTGQVPGTDQPDGPGPKVTAGDHGQNSGVFYTNVEGTAFVAAGSPMSVRQYVAPGFVAAMSPPVITHCGPHSGWTQEYRCDLPLSRVSYNLEGSVLFGN